MPDRLPPDWEVQPLRRLAQVVSGSTPSRHIAEFWDGGIPWVTPSDITGSTGRVLRSTKDAISAQGLAACSASLLPPGSLLMTSRATLGEIRIAGVQMCTNQGFKSLVPINGTDGRYLYYQMLQNRPRYENLGTGSTFLEVNKRDTERFEIPVAPGLVQRLIADVLGTVDEAIEQTEALIAKMQQIKAGMMSDLFTRGVTADGKIRPPPGRAPELYKDSPVGRIPASWGIDTLNGLVDQGRPIVYGILMPGQGHPGGVPVVKVKDIKGGRIDAEGLLLTSPEIDAAYTRSRLKPGDILLTIRGTVGRRAMVPDELAAANITQDTARVGIRSGSPAFYYHYLGTAPARRHLSINTLGVAVQGINLRDVRTTPVPVPDPEEQERIASRLDAANSRVQSEQATAAKLREFRSGLMADLLSGRVTVAATEAAT